MVAKKGCGAESQPAFQQPHPDIEPTHDHLAKDLFALQASLKVGRRTPSKVRKSSKEVAPFDNSEKHPEVKALSRTGRSKNTSCQWQSLVSLESTFYSCYKPKSEESFDMFVLSSLLDDFCLHQTKQSKWSFDLIACQRSHPEHHLDYNKLTVGLGGEIAK